MSGGAASGVVFLPCLLGPTGAGKSAAALALAERLPISVVNADSRQLYRDFPLITAQPSLEEQALCPHRLYGFLPTEKKLGAGAFARAAAAVIRREGTLGRLPLLVGGTGLYFKTLLEGIAPIPDIAPDISLALRERCRRFGSAALHAELAAADPAYAAKIHPNDPQRVTRALEVLAATGKPISWWHARPLPHSRYQACKVGIGLSLAELEPRLAARIDIMLEAGALQEAEAALARCRNPEAPGWTGIGCNEARQYLEGLLSLDECRAIWLKRTRAYAKRQLTWFRADNGIRWFRPDETRAVADYVSRRLREGAFSIGSQS